MNTDRTLSYCQDGRTEGIITVVESLLINKGLEVNKRNVIKVLRKLELERYIEDVIDNYFPEVISN